MRAQHKHTHFHTLTLHTFVQKVRTIHIRRLRLLFLFGYTSLEYTHIIHICSKPQNCLRYNRTPAHHIPLYKSLQNRRFVTIFSWSLVWFIFNTLCVVFIILYFTANAGKSVLNFF